ncbi:fatty acid metabolism regulator protein [Paenibacillus baekrokdamisoli]|uniref:Fatty acid metabolism regulator protein n=1 Tax=Paenibacillus baekrokdamisoli TaxID=1712516 RepID=A0A3G9JFI5_9BACL|nr:TetR/AcrR family transcriptional regulator [Paenibacillus baekrokdamisoli]MBB3073044.1 AcrR family transcriptional regulator [Paenibacillus baekrokdamisoli]BBH21719.1 fatty acid metabolism regulator protein [Paenibacillus baekrokdamisoli]
MATSRRKQLTEEMKAAVRNAAASLFAEKGYHSVTMREIAKEAGCSHTAIYLYFKNKEDLLQQIAIPPLLELEQRLLAQTNNEALDSMDKIMAAIGEYVVFCLTHGSLQTVLFTSGSVRVDVVEPELEVNRIRNRLFSHIMSLLQEATQTTDANRTLNNGRILVYYLQGFIHTYTDHSEPVESLLERILPIFNEGIQILVTGMRNP